jgi:hypothetical protein
MPVKQPERAVRYRFRVKAEVTAFHVQRNRSTRRIYEEGPAVK